MTVPSPRKAVAFLPAAVVAVAGWSHRWMNEDAYINLRVVEQLFAGHGPVFNAGERIEAATSPLWIVVLSVGRLLSGLWVRDEWIAVVASLLAAIAAFVVAAKATLLLHRDEDGLVVPVGLALVAAVAVVWDFSTSGLEMGLAWLWLATSWLVLVALARAATWDGRSRTAGAFVIGLAPLVRPDLGVMMVCFVATWFVLARPRRIAKDLVAMFALPVAYEIFRMGYYANVVPNTALAKDAGGLHLQQGWNYAYDFIDAYKLWLTAALVIAVLAVRMVHSSDRRRTIVTAAMLLAGLVHAGYIVAVGGDYMHGRLLLPAFFALALPASLCVRPRAALDLVLAGGAAVWAVVSIVWFRPPPIQPGYGVAQISDWRTVSGSKVVLDDAALGLNGHEAARAYAQGVRGYFTVVAKEPVAALDPNAFVLTLGSIGAPAYNAGRRVWVIDIGGLAEPLAARTDPVPDRPAGHRKQVDYAWYDARFAAPTPDDDPKVAAARHALQCGSVHDLLQAINDDLTPGRFVSNLWRSVGFTTLSIPADPVVAEQRFCSTP